MSIIGRVVSGAVAQAVRSATSEFNTAQLPVLSISSLGLVYDAAGGALTNGRTSTSTHEQPDGTVVDVLVNEIVYTGGLRTDHTDGQMYNAGVPGIEYTGGSSIRHELAATNLVQYSDDAMRWVNIGAGSSKTDALETWSGMKKVLFASGGQDWHRLKATDVALALSESIILKLYYAPGASGRVRLVFRDQTRSVESVVLGVVGSISVVDSSAGSLVIDSDVVVSEAIRRAVFSFVPSAAGTYAIAVGPDSLVLGEDVAVYGLNLVSSNYDSSWISSNGAATTRAIDDLRIPLVSGTNFDNAQGITLVRVIMKYDSDTTARAIFTLNGGVDFIHDSATINTISTTDGTNTINSAVTWVAGDELLIATIHSNAESGMSIAISKNGAAFSAWTDGIYDGAFPLGANFEPAKNNTESMGFIAVQVYGTLPGDGTVVDAKSWVETNAGSLT